MDRKQKVNRKLRYSEALCKVVKKNVQTVQKPQTRSERILELSKLVNQKNNRPTFVRLPVAAATACLPVAAPSARFSVAAPTARSPIARLPVAKAKNGTSMIQQYLDDQRKYFRNRNKNKKRNAKENFNLKADDSEDDSSGSVYEPGSSDTEEDEEDDDRDGESSDDDFQTLPPVVACETIGSVAAVQTIEHEIIEHEIIALIGKPKPTAANLASQTIAHDIDPQTITSAAIFEPQIMALNSERQTTADVLSSSSQTIAHDIEIETITSAPIIEPQIMALIGEPQTTPDVLASQTIARDIDPQTIASAPIIEPQIITHFDVLQTVPPSVDSETIAVIDEPQIEDNIIRRKKAKRGQSKKEEWKRNSNQAKRMRGESYTGFAKDNTGKYKQSVTKIPRMLAPPCGCKLSKSGKILKCALFTEENRKEIFKNFWSNMSWDERKVFVANNVEQVTKKRKRTDAETSRRSMSYTYYLKLDDCRSRVCKEMFLATLNLGEWSVKSWLQNSSEGMSTASKNRRRPQKPESDEHKGISEFLQSLPKLESHYCRASTSKLYLEPMWQSHSALYKEYVANCRRSNKRAMSRSIFSSVFENMNLSLYSPKKDQCDICVMHKLGHLSDVDYQAHQLKKEEARAEKTRDKDDASRDITKLVFTMDLQAVLLAPKLKASASFYKTKLAVHNFTLYNLATKSSTCYVWHEGEGGLVGSVFASMVCSYLDIQITDNIKEVTLYSDGCTYQNRNALMSNALLSLAIKKKVTLYQKYLEKGHTQMECDSVHSTIERELKKREIYVPADYLQLFRNARKKTGTVPSRVFGSYIF